MVKRLGRLNPSQTGDKTPDSSNGNVRFQCIHLPLAKLSANTLMESRCCCNCFNAEAAMPIVLTKKAIYDEGLLGLFFGKVTNEWSRLAQTVRHGGAAKAEPSVIHKQARLRAVEQKPCLSHDRGARCPLASNRPAFGFFIGCSSVAARTKEGNNMTLSSYMYIPPV